MGKRTLRGGVVVLAAAGVLAGATALPSQAATAASSPGWRAVKTYPAMSDFTGVAALAANGAFAVGDQFTADGGLSSKPLIATRWNGSTWLTLPQPPTVKGYAYSPGSGVIAASSTSNAWVFTQADNTGNGGDFTVAQRWSGSKWVNQSVFPASDVITSSVTSGPKDAWVFGQNISSSAVPYTAHWNGQSWTKVSLQLTVASVSALFGSDIWALGTQVKSGKLLGFVAEHYYKGAWHTLPAPSFSIPKGDGYQATSIVAESDTNVWAAATLSKGEGVTEGIVLLHYNGHSWTRVTVPYPVTGPFTLAADGSGGVWLSASEYTKTSFEQYFYRYDGKWIARIEIPHGKNIEISPTVTTWIPGTKSLWSVGLEWSTASNSGNAAEGIVLKYGT
jgi:hypothetical protein